MLEQPQPAAPLTQRPPEVVSTTPEPPASTSPLRALKNRELAVLLAGAFVANIGVWIGRVAVGVWAAETTGKASATGAVTAMVFLPALLGPIGGAMSDRADLKRWLLRTASAEAALAAALGLCASLGLLNVPLVAVFMLGIGSAMVMLTAGFNALIADLVPKADLTSAMFLNSGQWNLARVVGPLIAAAVIQFGSTALAFWLNALAIGGLLLAVVKLKFPPRTWHAPHEPLAQAVVNGVRTARDDAGIFSALAITALAGFFVAPFIGLVPVFALQVLHEGPAAASLLVAAQGSGAVVSALVSASLLDRIGAGTWMRMTCGALTALAVVFWLAPTLSWALLAMLPLGAAYLSLVTGASRVCLGRAPRGSQARMAGMYHVTLDITYATGLIATGAVADVVGLRQTGVACAVLFGVTLVALARSRRHLFSSLH